MSRFAVIQTGGKQYLVKENDEIVVDHITTDKTKKIELDTLAIFDTTKESLEMGKPLLKGKIQAEVIETLKGDKTRVAKFKAKVRYRNVRGFRPLITKIKITKV